MKIQALWSFILCLFYFQLGVSGDVYLGSREGDPASIVENVSSIHGDYTEVEVDLTVSSPDTLILSRFYSSRDTLAIATLGGWRFNPHCFLIPEKGGTFVRVGNPEGSIFTYKRSNTATGSTQLFFKVDIGEENSGLCNTVKGDISAWSNVNNSELRYDPDTDSFVLYLCTQGRRFYAKSSFLDAYLLTHEILPSGNKIFL